MLFWSWEVGAIFPTYEKIFTITKFVSSKFVAGMKTNRQSRRSKKFLETWLYLSKSNLKTPFTC
jgi:hypothetical protein